MKKVIIKLPFKKPEDYQDSYLFEDYKRIFPVIEEI